MYKMQKILTQAKHIVIFILLLTVIPLSFVRGFFAYLNYIGDAEIAALLNTTGDVYYKLCMDAAIISFILTYLFMYFIKKMHNLKIWLKILLIAALYVVLFFVWQFVLIFVLGNV